jgi:hypothetical protein
MPLQLRLPFAALVVIAGCVMAPFTAASAGQGARQTQALAPAMPSVHGAARAHHTRHVARHGDVALHHHGQRLQGEPRLSHHSRSHVRALTYPGSVGGLPWVQPYGLSRQFVVVEKILREPEHPRRFPDVTELPVLIGIRAAPQSAPAVIIVR